MLRRLGTFMVIFLLVLLVLLGVTLLPSSEIDMMRFVLMGLGCFGSVYGERARYRCRTSYVEKVRPKLHNHKQMLARLKL
jgi:hypothetical protein